MTRKEVIDVLGSLEQKYPVSQWMVDDVYVWPFIKIDLFFRWFLAQNPDANPITKKRQSTVGKISECIHSFVQLGKLLLQPERRVFVLFSGANSHRIDFEEVFINRYFQPLIEYLNDGQQQETLIIDYLPKDPEKKYKPQKNAFFLNEYQYAARILMKARRKRLTCQVSQFEEFIKEINELLGLGLDASAYQQSLVQRIEEIQVNAYIHDIFLRKYNPRYVMGLCYYNMPMYSLNYAAYKRGVPSIDMQHGGQGDLHPAYSGFKIVPEDGYNILPKLFWCWDQASASNIESWATNQTFHRVLIGGNPWIHYALDKAVDYNFPNKKIILYTLQFSYLDDYIIEAIKKTPSGYQWWLRAHPRKIHETERIRAQLQMNGLDHLVNLNDATDWPLPIILSNCCIHISKYSGSIIEAIQLGIPCIIIDEVGVLTYHDLISNGTAVAFIEKDAHNLLNLIITLAATQNKRNDSVNSGFHDIVNAMQNSRI